MTDRSEYVQWCEDAWSRPLTDAEALLVDVVCAGLGAPWNVPALARGRLSFSHSFGAAILYDGNLSTWDNNELTRLVFAAHDRCARVSVAPRGMKLRIMVHRRKQLAGDRPIMRGHPTLEQAVARWREHHPVTNAPPGEE